MPKADVYNVAGEKTGSLDLKDEIFGIKPKESVVHQVYTAMMSNVRQPWAHAKDKSEVRGGGKKPWAQKGTGRARHGSNRSPIWIGGGVTFGPLKERNYKQKINKKTKQAVLKMCLSDKVADNKLVILENLPVDGKTKILAALFEKLPGKGRTTLLLTDKKDENVLRSSKNIQKLDVIIAKDISIVDLLHHQFIVLTKKGVEILEKRLA